LRRSNQNYSQVKMKVLLLYNLETKSRNKAKDTKKDWQDSMGKAYHYIDLIAEQGMAYEETMINV